MLYAMQPVGGGPIKLGCTKDVTRRKKEHEQTYETELVLLWTSPGEIAEERELKKRFRSLRLHGEQFLAAPELIQFLGSELAVPHANAEPWYMLKKDWDKKTVFIDTDLIAKARWLASIEDHPVSTNEFINRLARTVVEERHKSASKKMLGDKES
jgi:hypothetical protein